jgi:hypothetical protein
MKILAILILGATASSKPYEREVSLDVHFRATVRPVLELIEQDGLVTVIAHHSPLGEAGMVAGRSSYIAGGGRWVVPKLLAGVH